MVFTLVLQSLYFFFPGYIANIFPALFAKLKFLPQPVDFNKKFGKKRIFGSHKTIGGIILGLLGALFAGFLQKYWLNNVFQNFIIFNGNIFLLALLLGIGALIGDLIKSFFKRRMKIKPGKSWIIADQLDFVVGGLLFAAIIYMPSWQIIVCLLIITPILHLLFNVLGYLLKIKDVWW